MVRTNKELWLDCTISFVGWAWHNLWFASLIRHVIGACLTALMSDKLREAIGGFPARKNNHQLLEEEVSFDRGLHPSVYPSFKSWSSPIFLGSPHQLYKIPFSVPRVCSICISCSLTFLHSHNVTRRSFTLLFLFTHRVFSSSTHTLSLSGSCFFTWSSQLPLTCLFSHSLACLPFSHSHESLSCSFFLWSTYSLLNRWLKGELGWRAG